jgi:hypothetical protein
VHEARPELVVPFRSGAWRANLAFFRWFLNLMFWGVLALAALFAVNGILDLVNGSKQEVSQGFADLELAMVALLIAAVLRYGILGRVASRR